MSQSDKTITTPEPPVKSTKQRITDLNAEQAKFCLQALLSTDRVTLGDMMDTLNFMEEMNVQ